MVLSGREDTLTDPHAVWSEQVDPGGPLAAWTLSALDSWPTTLGTTFVIALNGHGMFKGMGGWWHKAWWTVSLAAMVVCLLSSSFSICFSSSFSFFLKFKGNKSGVFSSLKHMILLFCCRHFPLWTIRPGTLNIKLFWRSGVGGFLKSIFVYCLDSKREKCSTYKYPMISKTLSFLKEMLQSSLGRI